MKVSHRAIFTFLNISLLLFIVVSFFQILQLNDYFIPQKVYSEESTTKLLGSTYLPEVPSVSPYPLLPLSILQTDDIHASQSADEKASSSARLNQDYCLTVPVLYYHHIQPISMAQLLGHAQLTIDSDIFAAQMKYLYDHGYTTISAEQLASALINREQVPDKSVVITVDDGYDDTYTYVYPVMKEYNFVASIMIPTGLIGRPGYLTWLHLKDMAATNNIKIYNHTVTHAPLGLISKEQIDEELSSSSADFKNNLNLDNNTVFTYPYGSYNELAIEELHKFGFYAAFSTENGTSQCVSTIMKLPRTRIGNQPLQDYGF